MTMPDLQTEMQKILRTWEEPYPQPETTEQPKESTVFKPTNNVTKATFNFIRDNAGCTRVHAIQKIVQDGHKKSSVSSLIGQMLRQGHITKNNYGMLYPNGTEYTPIKSSKTIANREKKVKTLKVKTSKIAKPSKAALDAAAEAMGGINMLVDHSHTPVYRSKIDILLDDISLNDAHELYRRLHLYFSGFAK
jgi:hypothetical protein